MGTGKILLKPNIKVEDIQIEMDKNSAKFADRIMDQWGRNIPIVKIGEYILGMGDLREFSLEIALNCLPSFTMVVNDEQYVIREALKNDIDKCVIFIGFKDWYIKFNGILDKSYSSLGSAVIRLTGEYYNPLLFNGEQHSFKDKKISDILKYLSEKTSMGLFGYDTEDLKKELDYSIMIGHRFLDFFDFIIKTYTTSLYSIDCNSFFHVADIETLRKQEYDKYSLDWSTGKSIPETDIIFKSYKKKNDSDDVDKKETKIPIETYSINTNFSEIFKETYSGYYLGYGGNGEELIPSNSKIGLGDNKTNTFFGFKKHKFPFYEDRINKLIGGNLITLTTNNIIFELTPLSIVGVELYLPFTSGRDIKLDEEHSGKKIVYGYSIEYKRKSEEINILSQTIKLI